MGRMNRNIVFTGPGKAEIVEKELPPLGTGEVLVKTVRSTISSGTERANLIGVPDGGVSIWSNSDAVTWPRQSGYSSSGVVVETGEGVRSVKAGDRVAMSWTVHAEYQVLGEERVYRLPDGVGFGDGALVHISTFPMAAVRKCRLEAGESAIVMGQGVLGQMAVGILRAAGAAPVIAADPDAGKRERALRLGADAAVDPLAGDFVERVKALTDLGRLTLGGKVEDAGAKVAIEVTGAGAALNGALDAMAPFGRVALLGCTRDSDFTVDYYHKVHGRGITLVGAHTWARPAAESHPGWWTTRDDAQAFIRLLEHGRIDLGGLVEEVHPVAECGEVYGRLAGAAAFPVVQFEW